MSLHPVLLRIGPLVSDAVRDVSVDMLDLGDLWLRWERDEFSIGDVIFMGPYPPVVQAPTGPILGLDRVVWILVAILSWLDTGRCLGMSCCSRVSMCYFVSGRGSGARMLIELRVEKTLLL